MKRMETENVNNVEIENCDYGLDEIFIELGFIEYVSIRW